MTHVTHMPHDPLLSSPPPPLQRSASQKSIGILNPKPSHHPLLRLQRSASQKSIGILKMPSMGGRSGGGGGGGGGGSAVAVAAPTQQLAVQQAAVFGVLGVWAVAQVGVEGGSSGAEQAGEGTWGLSYDPTSALKPVSPPPISPVLPFRLQAVLETPDAQLADTAGLQLTLSLLYSVYSLKEYKKMDIGVGEHISMERVGGS